MKLLVLGGLDGALLGEALDDGDSLLELGLRHIAGTVCGGEEREDELGRRDKDQHPRADLSNRGGPPASTRSRSQRSRPRQAPGLRCTARQASSPATLQSISPTVGSSSSIVPPPLPTTTSARASTAPLPNCCAAGPMAAYGRTFIRRCLGVSNKCFRPHSQQPCTTSGPRSARYSVIGREPTTLARCDTSRKYKPTAQNFALYRTTLCPTPTCQPANTCLAGHAQAPSLPLAICLRV